MTREDMFRLIEQMNRAAGLRPHMVEYVTHVAELAYGCGERNGRVDGLEQAHNVVKASA